MIPNKHHFRKARMYHQIHYEVQYGMERTKRLEEIIRKNIKVRKTLKKRKTPHIIFKRLLNIA